MNQLPLRAWRARARVSATTTTTPSWRRAASKASSVSQLVQQRRDNSATATEAAAAAAVCPHLELQQQEAAPAQNAARIHGTAEWQNALTYNEIPGPKPLPILGNTWRWVETKTNDLGDKLAFTLPQCNAVQCKRRERECIYVYVRVRERAWSLLSWHFACFSWPNYWCMSICVCVSVFICWIWLVSNHCTDHNRTGLPASQSTHLTHTHTSERIPIMPHMNTVQAIVNGLRILVDSPAKLICTQSTRWYNWAAD